MKVVWIEESVVERWEHQENGSDRLRRETYYLPTYEYTVNGTTYRYSSVNRCPASEIWGGRWSDTMTRLSLNALLKTDPESLFSAELTAFCGLRFCCFSGS